MNERDFVYWLQGFFEISREKSLDESQTKIIKEHLALVFMKITKEKLDDDLKKMIPPYYPPLTPTSPITPDTPWKPYEEFPDSKKWPFTWSVISSDGCNKYTDFEVDKSIKNHLTC